MDIVWPIYLLANPICLQFRLTELGAGLVEGTHNELFC